MYKCLKCGNNSIIKVASEGEFIFYSCTTVDCGNYALLMCDIGIDGDHLFILFEDMVGGMRSVLNDEEHY